MAFAFLAASVLAVAQDSGGADSAAGAMTPERRPDETSILLDDAVEPVTGDEATGERLPGVGFGDFVRVVLVLGVVIALIYAFVWMLRRFSGVRAEGSDVIKVLSTRPLKGDAAVHLVETGARLFLIGSGGGSVNLISEIDDRESIDEIRLNASRAPAPAAGGFARLFKDRFGTGPTGRASGSEDRQDTPAGGGEVDDPAAFLRRQRDRLKDL